MTGRRTVLRLAALGATSLALSTTRAALAAETGAAAPDLRKIEAALLDGYAAAFNAHDPAAFKAVIADNYIQHNGRSGPGLAALQSLMHGYFDTFPDFHMEIEDRIFSDDKVVSRSTLAATHTHPVQLGPNAPVFAPTGNKLSWGAIDIWRVADGRFIEHWDQNDFVSLGRQLQGK
jgi:predicted ester cyclase